MKFFLIGGGKVGTAFAYHLIKSGNKCSGVYDISDRALKRFQHYLPEVECFTRIPQQTVDFVVVAVTDDHLAELKAKDLEPLTFRYIFHTSGFFSSDILPDRRELARLSIHPLMSMPDIESALERLPAARFAIEGDDFEWGEALIAQFGSRSFRILKKEKELYHIAAVLAGNFILAPILASFTIGRSKGWIDDNLIERFMPLMQSVLSNVQTNGPETALSGPVQRGDIQTIRHQITLLKKSGLSEEATLYEAIVSYLSAKRGKGEEHS